MSKHVRSYGSGMFYKDSDPGTAFWVIHDPDPTLKLGQISNFLGSLCIALVLGM
jgi:hypothetical protein